METLKVLTSIKLDIINNEVVKVGSTYKQILDTEEGQVIGTLPDLIELINMETLYELLQVSWLKERELLLNSVVTPVTAVSINLDNLTIMTSFGNTFDANQKAIVNMLAAITAANELSLYEYEWKLADNSIKVITLIELKEALVLSIQAAGDLILNKTALKLPGA